MKLPFIYIIIMVGSLFLLYLFPEIGYDQMILPALFWFILSLYLSLSVLKDEILTFYNFKNLKKWFILVPYLATHYIVYSLLLEEILFSFYGTTYSGISNFISLTYSPFFSHTIITVALSIFFNPTLVIFLKPGMLIELSAYSLSLGFLISLLVTSAVLRLLSLRKISIRKKAEIFALALLGIIAGAGCCVSIPLLIASAISFSVTVSIMYWQGAFAIYLLLPIVALIILKHISSNLKKIIEFKRYI